MITSAEIKVRSRDYAAEFKDYIQANPGAALLGALCLGFAVGLLTRKVEHEKPAEPLHDAVAELTSLLKPLAGKTRKAYHDTSDAVRDAVGHAMDKAKDIDVDDYADPIVRWWKRLWK